MMIWTVLVIACVLHPIAGAIGDKGCTDQGGTCVDWRYYKCTAGVETGICSGDSNRRCCLECDAACQTQEAVNAQGDTDCENDGGTCQDNSNYCSGSYQSGKCGGPSSRQCCSSNTSGGGGGIIGGGKCNLVTYSSTYVVGYNGLKVEVDDGFESYMNDVNTYARQCDVTVYVTHAFREEGQNLGGTVVPPASNSNHLVGHAIDFNLDTPEGWCNGDCMYYGYNSYSECFINKVRNAGMRWGGVWSPSDPVHIDDGLNVYHPTDWDALYYDLQGNCV